jgi:hypothetical protein
MLIIKTLHNFIKNKLKEGMLGPPSTPPPHSPWVRYLSDLKVTPSMSDTFGGGFLTSYEGI